MHLETLIPSTLDIINDPLLSADDRIDFLFYGHPYFVLRLSSQTSSLFHHSNRLRRSVHQRWIPPVIVNILQMTTKGTVFVLTWTGGSRAELAGCVNRLEGVREGRAGVVTVGNHCRSTRWRIRGNDSISPGTRKWTNVCFNWILIFTDFKGASVVIRFGSGWF